MCLCDSEDVMSTGIGSNTSCVVIPVEDFTYVSLALKVIGYVFLPSRLHFPSAVQHGHCTTND